MQKQIISLLISYARPYKVRVGLVLFCTVLTVFVGAFMGPFIISGILEKIQAGNVTLSALTVPIILYMITQIFGEVIGWRINLYLIWTFETMAQKDLFRDIFRKLTNESLAFHSNRFSGSLVSQTSKLTGSFERFWDTIVFQLTPAITSIIATIVILGFVFWQYALFVFILSIIFILFVFYGSRFMAVRNTLEAQASTQMNGRLADSVTNVMAIKSHGMEEYELGHATTYAEKWRQRSLSTMRGFLGISTVYSVMTSMVQIVALIAAIWASQYNLISIGVVYLAISYTLTVARQLWEMNNIMRNYNRIIGDATDMVEILQTPYTLENVDDEILKPNGGAIDFQNVIFKHDPADKQPLFNNFSLTIPAGQKVGIVGHSGSGKSSLTRILLRFSDIEDGTIMVDGQDIKKVTQQSLREAIAYVPQEPLLFHRTLRENIAYGKQNASEKEVVEAARRAHALEFIERLPQGFDTLVGERGVKLSGGQRQRVAIARAILKDAPILVLDEATSALDSESEKLIQASLDELMKGRTSIVIAHRLSTIAKLDRIVVLEDGTIDEDGTHEQLLKQKGTYATLWSHQTGGFIEE